MVAVNGANVLLKDDGIGGAILTTVRAVIRPFKSAHDLLDSTLGVANHVVTVTKFDAARDKVYIENSWGKDQDGWMSVRDLWKAV